MWACRTHGLADRQTKNRDVKSNEKKIDSALTIVKDCGLSGVVSVSLLHRHFQISSDELLVEVQAVGQSDISVYNRSSEIAKNAVPYMFFQVVFDNTTKLVFLQPLEFVNFGDDAAAINRLAEDINSVAQNPTFLFQFHKHLSAAILSHVNFVSSLFHTTFFPNIPSFSLS